MSIFGDTTKPQWCTHLAGRWWHEDAARPLSGACWELADTLAEDAGRRSEWLPPSGPNGEDDGLWIPSHDDRAAMLTYPIPAAAVLRFVCEWLKVDEPEIVQRAFALGCEPLPWELEGRPDPRFTPPK